MRKLLLILSTPLLIHCGGGECTDSACLDGGADAKADAVGDAAPLDAHNDVATDASDAGDAGEAGLACTSPAGCGGNTPTCCGTVVLNGGTAPNCTATSVTSACTAQSQCTTAFVQSCSGTETVQLCAQGPDCAGDPTNNKCCTFTSGNQSLTFCVSQAIATGAGASCK